MLYLNSAAIVTSEVYLYHLQNSLTQKIALAVYANAIFVLAQHYLCVVYSYWDVNSSDLEIFPETIDIPCVASFEGI